jgi:hypothetical protein
LDAVQREETPNKHILRFVRVAIAAQDVEPVGNTEFDVRKGGLVLRLERVGRVEQEVDGFEKDDVVLLFLGFVIEGAERVIDPVVKA